MLTTIKTKSGREMPAFWDGTEHRILGRVKSDKPKMYVPPFSQYLAAIGAPVIDLNSIPDYDRYQKNVPILDQDGLGCHTEDTEVLTDKGWRLWSEYNWEDSIGTMNPFNGILEYQKPTAKHIYDYKGDIYHSNNRSLDFAVTPNHRMFIRKWDESKRTLSNKYSMEEIQNCGWYFGLPHAPKGYIGVNLDKISIGNYKNIPGDDFVSLVSLILSDGWAGSSEATKNLVSFCCFNEKRYDKVAKLAQKLGFNERPSRKGVWFKTDSILAEWVRQNCYNSNIFGAHTKQIPDIIKGVSNSQLNLFIDFYGDKHTTSEDSRSFYSVSKSLVDGLQEILLKMGKRGSIYHREARSTKMKDGREIKKENCHSDYTLIERRADRLSIDKKKHLYIEKYNGNVYCATVPNGLIVTRRNNSILVSGNSCCGHSFSTTVMRARDSAGMTFQGLSADSLYAQVNGGHDGGSDPADCVDALEKNGICLLSDVPDQWVLWENISASAKQNALRFRIPAGGIYQCKNFAEVVTADYLGFSVNFTVNVGANFGPGSDGVVGFAGGYANHCVAGGEAKRTVNGQVQYRFRNSWGCFSSDTEILTELGWSSFDNLPTDVKVATLNLDTEEIEYQLPTEYFEYDYDGDLYNFIGRDIDQLVTPNHNIVNKRPDTHNLGNKNWILTQADQLPCVFEMKKDGKWIGEEREFYYIDNYQIEMDIWLEFLGYYLSEGYTTLLKHKRLKCDGSIGSNGRTHIVGICQQKECNINKIQECLNKLPFNFQKSKIGWSVGNKKLYNELIIFGKSHEKFIPDYVKNITSRQQKIFYNAMMLGDGSISKCPTGEKVTYYTSSKRLVDDFQELLLKIGYAGDISCTNRIGRDNSTPGHKNITRHIEYRIGIKRHETTPRKKWEPILIPYNGKVFCVSVPNKTIYIRRNGKACWSGNSSWGENGLAWITSQHIDQQQGPECYALMWTLDDPNDPAGNIPTTVN